MTASRITAKQMIAWATQDVVVRKLRAALKEADDRLAELHARYESRLEPSTEKRDKGKDVKVGRAGGWGVRFTRYRGARRFSLGAFEAAGNVITPEMEEHITRPDGLKVTFKKLDGPVKPGAVEPA